MVNQNRPKLVCMSFIFIFLFIFSAKSYAADFHRTQIIRSIPLTIIIKAPEAKRKNVFEAMQKLFETAQSYFDLWSLENKSGDIFKINRSAGIKPVKVQSETLTLITAALLLNTQTRGVFDILYPTPRQFRKYNSSEIKINTHNETIFLQNAHYKMDTNGIAKGQILDILTHQLGSYGFKKYLINAGGDLKAQGSWPICLKSPVSESTHCAIKFQVKNKAVMTSGNYERGEHIFNPKESRFKPEYKSTTVIDSNASLAGPLAVALFIKPELKKQLQAYFKSIKIYQ